MGKKHPRGAKIKEDVRHSVRPEFNHGEVNITGAGCVCEKEPLSNGQRNCTEKKKRNKRIVITNGTGVIEDRAGATLPFGGGVSSTTPRLGKTSEIDEIFSQGKAAICEKKLNDIEALKQQKVEKELKKVNPFCDAEETSVRRQQHKFKGKPAPQQWAWQDEVRPLRYHDEGLPIYSWDSLRINKGGGTDLCPFDCNCCF